MSADIGVLPHGTSLSGYPPNNGLDEGGSRMAGKRVRVRWVFAAVGVLLAFWGIQILVSVCAGIAIQTSLMAQGITSDSAYEQAYEQLLDPVLLVSQLVGLAVGLPWFRYLLKRRTRPGSTPEAFDAGAVARTALAAVGLGIAMQLAISVLLTLVLPLMPALESDYSEVESTMGVESVVAVISLVVMAPLAEEVFFRGVALEFARRGVRSWMAANVLQALLFGIAHGNIVQGVYAFAIGFVLGMVRLRTRRLWPGMALHFGVNCSSLFVGSFGLLPEPMASLLFLAGGLAGAVALVIAMVHDGRVIPGVVACEVGPEGFLEAIDSNAVTAVSGSLAGQVPGASQQPYAQQTYAAQVPGAPQAPFAQQASGGPLQARAPQASAAPQWPYGRQVQYASQPPYAPQSVPQQTYASQASGTPQTPAMPAPPAAPQAVPQQPLVPQAPVVSQPTPRQPYAPQAPSAPFSGTPAPAASYPAVPTQSPVPVEQFPRVSSTTVPVGPPVPHDLRGNAKGEA